MDIKKIVKAGDPLLKKVAEPVTDFNSDALRDIINVLFKNMDHYSGAGLAAPQLGIFKRILVYGINKNPRYPTAECVPYTVLINPEIYYSSSETFEMYEGCLSLPHIRGNVIRPKIVKYRAYTVEGKLIDREATGFEARVIQHELDHLNGVLFPMRMTDMSTFQYSEL